MHASSSLPSPQPQTFHFFFPLLKATKYNVMIHSLREHSTRYPLTHPLHLTRKRKSYSSISHSGIDSYITVFSSPAWEWSIIYSKPNNSSSTCSLFDILVILIFGCFSLRWHLPFVHFVCSLIIFSLVPDAFFSYARWSQAKIFHPTVFSFLSFT